MTEKYKYKPTAAEKRLLEVLINPEYLGKNVTDLCNLAEISRNKYYDAMKKKEFQELVADITQDLIKGKIGDVLNATYKYSLTAKGHQDRKVLLTMAGLYVDKKETEVTGSLDIANTSTEIGKYLAGSDSS